MTPPAPCLLPLQHCKLIETNRRKHVKLLVMQEKSQARRQQQQDAQNDDSAQMILHKIDNSNFSELNSDKEDDENDSDSYDSQPFYAYECQQDDGDNGIVGKSRTEHIISVKEVADSFLVLDFKGMAEQPPKINVLPPVVAAQPKVEKTSIGVQTAQIPAAKPLQKQASRAVAIPQLKKQAGLSSNSQLQQRSQVKKQNMILTDSIEMVYRKEQQKEKKASTFMEYYNSQPVKAPSNILERYIKRKK